MQLHERGISVPLARQQRGLIEHIEKALSFRLVDGETPLRFAVTSIDNDHYHCEVGCLGGGHPVERQGPHQGAHTIFEFRRRGAEKTGGFNVVFLVPTGIGAEIGGHAGDTTPAAQLLASGCDLRTPEQ